MNYTEAYKALLNGELIRRSDWNDDAVLFMEKEEITISNDQNFINQACNKNFVNYLKSYYTHSIEEDLNGKSPRYTEINVDSTYTFKYSRNNKYLTCKFPTSDEDRLANDWYIVNQSQNIITEQSLNEILINVLNNARTSEQNITYLVSEKQFNTLVNNLIPLEGKINEYSNYKVKVYPTFDSNNSFNGESYLPNPETICESQRNVTKQEIEDIVEDAFKDIDDKRIFKIMTVGDYSRNCDLLDINEYNEFMESLNPKINIELDSKEDEEFDAKLREKLQKLFDKIR